MVENANIKPNYLFEVSWEVCNKVGGIYTVVSTKIPMLSEDYGKNYILIGPDVWKETGEHPEFHEDITLYRHWKESALAEGLNFRIGRWNIKGNPVVILIDFTPLFSTKDDIFAGLWEKFQLDSISGDWDYIEPALFGYAAARVIESFYEFNLSARDKIVVQFHEWMTGCGVLYLKEHVPQAGTVFTTHATILGRSIATNHIPLYKDMNILDADALAKKYNIVAKHSLEKLAAHEADCFTTVSEITARQCRQFLQKDIDLLTPNGFDDSFIPPESKFKKKREEAKELLLKVADALLNRQVSRNSLLVIHSGRYEFRNKGIDLFIDALGKLNKSGDGKEILAFIMVPAHHTGPNQALKNNLTSTGQQEPVTDHHTTHVLFDEPGDLILNRIMKNGLLNRPEDRVNVIFIPAYLNGNDGIFNWSYYDLLIGFDLSVFPSYYEPWGYTPLESTAFRIPTITTSLAGFGMWVRTADGKRAEGVRIIERTDDNENRIADDIVSAIRDFQNKSAEEITVLRNYAYEVSRTALWENLLVFYEQAWAISLKKVLQRSELFKGKRQHEAYFLKDISKEVKPVWSKVFVEPAIPPKLEKLNKLSKNLWWAWHYEAEELFESINPHLWSQIGQNPMALIESLARDQLKALEKNKDFLVRLDVVYKKFEEYMEKAVDKSGHIVAYFSMEYGLHDILKTYSGGLGMLAGDYLKQASDSNKNIVGIGLLYRYGYFQQGISLFGDQIAMYSPQKFTHLPLLPVRDKDGEWIRVSIALPGRNLYAKVWKVEVGRTPLYLLDADISDNLPNDRIVTHQLYGGDWENRFMQELLLGVGGMRMLNAIGIKADIYHCNEGHAAFMNLERLRMLVQDEGLTFSQALEVVRSSSLFTTHTPVPAGHDSFGEDLLRTYISHYPNRMNITWQQFMNLGKFKADDPGEKFSMSVLAARLSQEINGVSKIHGRVSREMFSQIYEGYFPKELHIGYVTNGVHYPTWAGKHWQQLYQKDFGDQFPEDQSNHMWWRKIHKVPDKTIWTLRNHYRHELIGYIKKRLSDDLTRRQENPKIKHDMIESLDENALTVGFARRFATYKRAHLLFTSLERFSSVINDKSRPIQFIFAGKAHPADKAGQDLIKRIIEISKRPEFIGKVTFIENYDIELAKKLVQGVDVWLNTPTRPLEASGTSGEKALMNGVLNFSVLDGWWAEGYKPNAGWALQEALTYANQQFQDLLDAEMIYDAFQDEIMPLFYDREDGIPVKWISFIKNSISEIAPDYTMKRMLDEYESRFYHKLINRSAELRADDYKIAKEIDAWKTKIMEGWNRIEVLRLAVPDSTQSPLHLGDDFIAEVELKLNGLSAEDIGIDILFGQKEDDVVRQITFQENLVLVFTEGVTARYTCRIPVERVGVYDFAFRLYPKNRHLPHRQDFPLIKWI
jgi:phosphorylase/glycogen(starch) synthase